MRDLSKVASLVAARVSADMPTDPEFDADVKDLQEAMLLQVQMAPSRLVPAEYDSSVMVLQVKDDVDIELFAQEFMKKNPGKTVNFYDEPVEEIDGWWSIGEVIDAT